MKSFVISILLSVILLSGCSKNDNPVSSPPVKDSNFSSTEEYIQNPSINNAIQNSGIEVNQGNNPPPLAGEYEENGEYTDASQLIRNTFLGHETHSIFTLYNQTQSGKIDFKENAGNLTVWASGGYLTGANGSFTVWQESIQSGADAGLPEDITVYVSLLISGSKLSNGDLQASGITIITKVETDNSSYNTNQMVGLWYMWQAYCTLTGPPGSPLTQEISNKANSLTYFDFDKILKTE